MVVKAKQNGFYDGHRKRVGDLFEIKSKEHFSSIWMEKVEADKIEKIEPKKKKKPEGALALSEVAPFIP